MSLEIETHINVTTDKDDFIISHFKTSIKVGLDYNFFEESEDLEFEGECAYKIIGHILAARFDYSYANYYLIDLADSKDGDIYNFAEFILSECYLENFFAFPDYIFYIDRVFIKPNYRGHGYALQALAMFLELFAKGQVVGFHPCPSEDLKDRYPDEQGKNLMKKYWSKLGFNNYSEENNILWTEEWRMPQWLKNRIFLKN